MSGKAPTGIAKLLAGLNSMVSSPNDAGVMGLAQGLLAASAPHMLTPVSGGQALGMALSQSQAYQRQALANALQQQAALPFMKTRTQEFQRAFQHQDNPNLSPAQRADQASIALQFAGVHPQDVPSLAGQITKAQSVNKPTQVAPGARTFGPVGSPSVGAQGSLPTGGAQAPGGGPIGLLPGTLPAIAGTSRASAGGSAQGAFPFQQALKNSGYFSSPLTSVAGFRAPRAPALNLNSLYPQGSAPAHAAGPTVPPAPNRVPPAGAPAHAAGPTAPPAPNRVPPAGAALRASVGLTHAGLTPSQISGQNAAQKNATDQLNTDIQTGTEAQQRIANLQELASVAGNLQTGPGAEGRIAVEKALASIPGFAGMAAKLGTITDAQIFNKTALNLSLQTVSSAGQHAYGAFESVMNAFPELSKTPLANAVVTGSLLATARYQAARGQFAGQWQKANNGMGFVQGKGTANAQWAQHAPFMTFFLDSLPPEAVTALMQKAKTNTTLRNEILKARKGYWWLQQNVPGYGG